MAEDADQASQNQPDALARQLTPISPLSEASSHNSGTEQIGRSRGQRHMSTLQTYLSPAADNISAPSTVFEGDASTQIAEHSSTCQHRTLRRDPENGQFDCEPQHEHEKLNEPIVWNPLWLSPSVLISLSTLLALLSTATIILWRLSVRDHGFELLTTNHYAWTYGPTAVLTIVMSLWTRISYWGKILQPWQELKTGPTSAEKSVLLDYISPILPINLWNAVRLRHFSVQLVIYGGLILKLVTVASTGLLAPSDRGLPFETITLETLTVFNASAVDTYDEMALVVTMDGTAIEYEAYALIADKLPFPNGIEPTFAFQQFTAPANSTATTRFSTIRATVEAFRPVIKCEATTLTPLNASTFPCSNGACLEIFSTASWPGCSRSGMYPETIDMIFMYSPMERPSRQLYGGKPYNNVSCDGSYWAFVTMFDVHYNQTSIPGAMLRSERHGDSDTWGTQILQTTAVSCSISYSMVDAMVTYDLAQEPLKPVVELAEDPGGGGRFLDGFPPAAFAEAMIWYSDSLRDLAGTILTNGGDEFAPDTFFELMSIIANKSESDFLGNPTAMSSAASTVLTFTGVQIANTYAKSSTLPLQGEISIRTLRLTISPLASCLMVSGLLSVASGAIALVWARPRDVIPCKVGPISGMATILGASPNFQATLRDCGKLGTKDIANFMRLFTFQSSHISKLGFSITVSTNPTSVDSDEGPLTKSGMEFWKPTALRPWVFAIISILSLSIIVMLELLQSLSDRTDGIAATVDPDSLLVTFGTRFMPATLFMTVAVLYDSIDFNVAVFGPFSKPKRGKARGKHTLTHTLLGRFPMEVLVSASYHGNWAAAFATFGALLGSFLTIAASGLYIVEKIPAMLPVTINRVDQFDPSWPDSVRDDGGAAALLTEFELLNLSYPAWTTSELAFPELRLSTPDMALINGTSRPAIAVRVPAVRGELQCRFSMPQGSLLYEDDNKDWLNGLEVNTSTPVPAGCNVDTPSLHWSGLLGPDGDLDLLGQVHDLHPGISKDTYGEFAVPLQENSPPGCPSLAFTFGRYSDFRDQGDDIHRPLNLRPDAFTSMWCYQLMAEVQTDVTLSIPDFTVTSAVPDESTTKYLASGPDGKTAFPWRPQLHFQNEVVIWDGNITFGGENSAQLFQTNPYLIYPDIDGFFALMLYPTTGFRVDEMLGADNRDRLLEAIQSVYRRYMAQVASAKMRVPATSSVPETYTAHWENSNRGVIRQSPASKLALQILLGIMFACGVAAYLLVETREVLPHDPCSIAGLASLLAESSLCSGENAAAEKAGNGADQDAFIGAQIVSLGWWPSPGSREGRFGIDVGEALWMGRDGEARA